MLLLLLKGNSHKWGCWGSHSLQGVDWLILYLVSFLHCSSASCYLDAHKHQVPHFRASISVELQEAPVLPWFIFGSLHSWCNAMKLRERSWGKYTEKEAVNAKLEQSSVCISTASKQRRNNTAKGSAWWEQHVRLNGKDVERYTL